MKKKTKKTSKMKNIKNKQIGYYPWKINSDINMNLRVPSSCFFSNENHLNFMGESGKHISVVVVYTSDVLVKFMVVLVRCSMSLHIVNKGEQ